MIPPGALVMLTPLIVGVFIGVETLSSVLPGSLVSGVQVTLDRVKMRVKMIVFNQGYSFLLVSVYHHITSILRVKMRVTLKSFLISI